MVCFDIVLSLISDCWLEVETVKALQLRYILLFYAANNSR